MRFYIRSFQTQYQNLYRHWRIIRMILYALNRETELGRLVTWATKKRLSGPARAYKSKQAIINSKLSQLNLQYRRQYKMACALHSISCLISPTPRPRKGAAACYRNNYQSKKKR